MNDLGEASTSTEAGSAGVAGVVVSTSNPSKQYLQNAEGQEWTQLIEKDLWELVSITTFLAYLSAEKMDVDNSEAVDPEAGKYLHYYGASLG